MDNLMSHGQFDSNFNQIEFVLMDSKQTPKMFYFCMYHIHVNGKSFKKIPSQRSERLFSLSAFFGFLGGQYAKDNEIDLQDSTSIHYLVNQFHLTIQPQSVHIVTLIVSYILFRESAAKQEMSSASKTPYVAQNSGYFVGFRNGFKVTKILKHRRAAHTKGVR